MNACSSSFTKSKALFDLKESFRNKQGTNYHGERKANQSEWKFAS